MKSYSDFSNINIDRIWSENNELINDFKPLKQNVT